MQKIIKSRRPSRQLLETVNFALMKFFDSLVKTAISRVFLFFLEIRVMHFFPDHIFDPAVNMFCLHYFWARTHGVRALVLSEA